MLSLLLSACTGPRDGTCSTDGNGSITFHPALPDVTLVSKAYLYIYDSAGAPVGSLEDGDTLDVPAGDYILGVGNVRAEDDGSGFAATYGLLNGTAFGACVSDGAQVDVTSTYELQPGSRHLWFSAGESLAALAPESLTEGTTAVDLRLDVEATNDFRGLGFDPLGNLWAATSDTYGVRLLVFEPGDVDAAGAAEPRVTVTNTLFDAHASITEIAFAPDGQLVGVVDNTSDAWVGAFGFDPGAQIVALVTTETAVVEPTWTATVDGLVRPADLAFDGSGRAWITDTDGPSVLRIDALGAATLTPAARVTALRDTVALRGPTDLAFTPSGSLIVDYWTDATLVELPASELVGAGELTIDTAGTTFDVASLPDGLAVTGAGTVWFGDVPSAVVSADGVTVVVDGLPAPRDLQVVASPF